MIINSNHNTMQAIQRKFSLNIRLDGLFAEMETHTEMQADYGSCIVKLLRRDNEMKRTIFRAT